MITHAMLVRHQTNLLEELRKLQNVHIDCQQSRSLKFLNKPIIATLLNLNHAMSFVAEKMIDIGKGEKISKSELKLHALELKKINVQIKTIGRCLAEHKKDKHSCHKLPRQSLFAINAQKGHSCNENQVIYKPM